MGNFSPLPSDLVKLSQIVQVFTTDEPEKELRSQLFEEMAALVKSLPLADGHRKTIEDFRLKISELEPHVQNNAGLWFLASVFTISNMKTDAAQWMLGCGLWTELGLLQDPSLRVRLSNGMYDLAADEGSREVWDAFIKSVRGTSGQRGLMLLAIPFYELKKQGVAEDGLVKVAAGISQFQTSRTSKFRDVYRVKLLLNIMHFFAQSGIYSPELKRQGLEKIFFEKQEGHFEVIRHEERIVKNVTAVKGLLQLQDLSWPIADKDLDAQFRASLGELIPLEKLEGNASEKYDEIFGTCRNPGGLLTYAAGLKTLNEPAVMQCLGEFTVSVLDGTFKSKRYDTANNPHLATISTGNSDLIEKWKREITVGLESLSSEAKGQNSLDLREWITNKLITDNHLADADLSFVKKYLQAATADQRAEIFSDLVAKIKLAMKEEEKNALRAQINVQKGNNKKLTEDLSRKKKDVKTLGNSGQEAVKIRLEKLKNEVKALEQDLSDSVKSLQRLDKDLKSLTQEATEDPVLQNLNFQKACLLSLKAGKDADSPRVIKLLEDINKAMKLYENSEFAHDVKGLLELVKSEKKTTKPESALKVVLTDDPIDLLLCGTDVSGSCQRLDGGPSLNKGLLGYLVDGKNRLLAIKDGNKIVSRCMLRLLWDGEKPVIFRERLYPDSIPSEHQAALNALAKQIAQDLGVPLTSKDGENRYGKDLEALGGPAPYEYSDGSGGVQKSGVYTIKYARQVD
ncbi:hypothetical protein [Estrella lausannensis]|nr:hypothetical protein [Estrella lausannensis]